MAEKAEKGKLAEYKRNLIVPEKLFVPMAVNHMGAWGPRMMKYFQEANEDYLCVINANKSPHFRYVKELISLAVCKANAVYLKRMRYGSSKANYQGLDGEIQ